MKDEIKLYLINKYNEKGKKMVGLEYISYILANYKVDYNIRVIKICKELSKMYGKKEMSINSAMNLYVSNVTYMSVKEFLVETYDELKEKKLI